MIRYKLVCDKSHGFESWFKNSDAFEAQVSRGFVTCPVCGSDKVQKAIMSPSVARTDHERSRTTPSAEAVNEPAGSPPRVAVPQAALLTEREHQLREMVRALRQHVIENAAYVGDEFADEARRIHAGEVEERAIYGEATGEEVRDLLEEGIEILPLPPAPEKGN
ncbi:MULTISPECIES: DUF1178 family protein [unclassified Chelatococcus]|uniref:DUF1178 family protein n=1 Tax=unclassified Chelatococcus TaxID=2638111 RepID=UPI001BCBED4C|nr:MULTISPECIES: DUF1178 family protein [unclassified Chelatococcus]MBS7697283.1 DUF1178 family protein [Chelatococcus sp. YT9]MBX3556420.1 DUF1178 family protein [Chelatococcus sp.]